MEYLALLHGINMGNKHRISMTELRTAFVAAGFDHVSSYARNGNVVFTSSRPQAVVMARCREALATWHLSVPLLVTPATPVVDAVAAAPPWWLHPAPNCVSEAFFMGQPQTAPFILQTLTPAAMRIRSSMVGPLLLVTADSPHLAQEYWALVPRARRNQAIIRNQLITTKLAELITARI
ncbi:DUF1697 domain-containing protein [Lacticaseibacillus thailandensis]|uniref:DUF1697 domain-containing protein n=1 Tax=Lacticaseibacillus thailandensis DSM 22698 = JCM 13996 TaxID=1423810 RepID=A0A0R2CGV0_9LACO|nr:DUF1697 domain-containing protein [Lacticaseibacillus thailandensis]KRM87452.1 hypothetical protein FD19_GL000956 [Lacticaseibacillus thailandensis DSM 22698 = JCM 13996]